jgi:hypothetical protein
MNSFTDYIKKRLIDLLNDRRIVVWYDPEKHFEELTRSFRAPCCQVLNASDSVLKARRRADEIYRQMNDSTDPQLSKASILIHIPWARGMDDESRLLDPFEVYARAGVAFGDTEDQQFESLARQAFPDRSDEITRLFREGKPTISLLDSLKKAQRYPLINQIFRTESASEVIAFALCDKAKAEAIERTPGCIEELARLLNASVGFSLPGQAKDWKTFRETLGKYILFTEFVFDLPEKIPDSLSAINTAGFETKELVYSACNRMRTDENLQETYMDMSRRIERSLKLPEMTSALANVGRRDTFLFEDQRMFLLLLNCLNQGKIAEAQALLTERKRSLWRNQPDRSLLWNAAERGAILLDTIQRLETLQPWTAESLSNMVNAYAQEGWADLDQRQRLFEHSIAAGEEDELAPLIETCRRRYRELALKIQDRFLALVAKNRWPPEGTLRQTRIFDQYVAPLLERREKVAFFIVDSLRFEMGRDLGEALRSLGDVEILHAASILPSITETGMAALLPNTDGKLRILLKDEKLIPVIGDRVLKGSTERMKFIREIYGDRFLDLTFEELWSSSRFKKNASKLKSVDLLVVRTQHPDLIGEQLGGRLARKYISDIIGDIKTVATRLVGSGFRQLVISADHGHILLPEILPGDVVSEPSGSWGIAKRRCRLGSGLSAMSGCLDVKAEDLGIQGDATDICIPKGFKVFADGEAYLHGGLSLQESVIPLLLCHARELAAYGGAKPEVSMKYRSDKFVSRVIGLKLAFNQPNSQSNLLQFTQLGPSEVYLNVRVEAYNGTSAQSKVVGEAADCDDRDEKTLEVSLQAGKETSVPVLIEENFKGPMVEIRVSDPLTRVVWARLSLKNAIME